MRVHQALLASGLATLLVVGPLGCSLVLDFDEVSPASAACGLGEPPAAPGEEIRLEPQVSVAAGICTAGDRDRFAINVPQSGLRVSITLTEGEGGDLDVSLHGLGAAAQEIGRSTTSLVCPPETTAGPACPKLGPGVYLVEVSGHDDQTTNPSYSLSYAYAPIDAPGAADAAPADAP